MASEDVIELGSSDDEEPGPAPKSDKYQKSKKVNRVPNAMVHIPRTSTMVNKRLPGLNSIQIANVKSMTNANFTIGSVKRGTVLSGTLSPAKVLGITNPGKALGITNPTKALGIIRQAKNSITIRPTAPPNSSVTQKGNKDRFVINPFNRNTTAQQVGVKVNKNLTSKVKIPTILPMNKIPCQKNNRTKPSTKSPTKPNTRSNKPPEEKYLSHLPPGITITRMTQPSQRKRALPPNTRQVPPAKKQAMQTPQNIHNVVGAVLTVELDDDDDAGFSTAPQTSNSLWYLRPEDQKPEEDIQDPLINKQDTVQGSPKKTNEEEPTKEFVEITIEDSPVKKKIASKENCKKIKEIAIEINDSPVKKADKDKSKSEKVVSSDDESQNNDEKTPNSKKKLNYPGESKENGPITVTQDFIMVDINIDEVPNELEKQGCSTPKKENSIQECPIKPVNNDIINLDTPVKTDIVDVPSESSAPKNNTNLKLNDFVCKDMEKESSTVDLDAGEYHPNYLRFIDLCFQLEDSGDMKTIVDKKIKAYYRQVPKEYTESDEFIDMISGKIASIKACPSKMYLHIKDIVDELNLQRKVARAQVDVDPVVEEARPDEIPDGSMDPKRCRQIKKLENTLKKLHKAVQKLEEQEVDFDDDVDSVYLLTDRYKDRLIRVHAKLCQLTNTKMPSEPRIHIEPRVGQPNGPARRLEAWINKKVPVGAPLPFPDFYDVLQCVKESNQQDQLEWNDVDIMEEARDLFTRCGRKLQRRRQENEWRLASSRLTTDVDPAEESPDLRVKLEENRKMASRKESDVINKYADRQHQLNLEAIEISDNEAEKSPVESDDEVIEDIEPADNNKVETEISKETGKAVSTSNLPEAESSNIKLSNIDAPKVQTDSLETKQVDNDVVYGDTDGINNKIHDELNLLEKITPDSASNIELLSLSDSDSGSAIDISDSSGLSDDNDDKKMLSDIESIEDSSDSDDIQISDPLENNDELIEDITTIEDSNSRSSPDPRFAVNKDVFHVKDDSNSAVSKDECSPEVFINLTDNNIDIEESVTKFKKANLKPKQNTEEDVCTEIKGLSDKNNSNQDGLQIEERVVDKLNDNNETETKGVEINTNSLEKINETNVIDILSKESLSMEVTESLDKNSFNQNDSNVDKNINKEKSVNDVTSFLEEKNKKPTNNLPKDGDSMEVEQSMDKSSSDHKKSKDVENINIVETVKKIISIPEKYNETSASKDNDLLEVEGSLDKCTSSCDELKVAENINSDNTVKKITSLLEENNETSNKILPKDGDSMEVEESTDKGSSNYNESKVDKNNIEESVKKISSTPKKNNETELTDISKANDSMEVDGSLDKSSSSCNEPKGNVNINIEKSVAETVRNITSLLEEKNETKPNKIMPKDSVKNKESTDKRTPLDNVSKVNEIIEETVKKITSLINENCETAVTNILSQENSVQVKESTDKSFNNESKINDTNIEEDTFKKITKLIKENNETSVTNISPKDDKNVSVKVDESTFNEDMNTDVSVKKITSISKENNETSVANILPKDSEKVNESIFDKDIKTDETVKKIPSSINKNNETSVTNILPEDTKKRESVEVGESRFDKDINPKETVKKITSLIKENNETSVTNILTEDTEKRDSVEVEKSTFETKETLAQNTSFLKQNELEMLHNDVSMEEDSNTNKSNNSEFKDIKTVLENDLVGQKPAIDSSLGMEVDIDDSTDNLVTNETDTVNNVPEKIPEPMV